MWCLSTLTRCLTQGELILLADWAPQRLAELWYGVDVSATNSTHRLLPLLGLVSKPYCLTPLSCEAAPDELCDVEDSDSTLSTLRPVKQLLMSCVMSKTQTPRSPLSGR